MTENLFARLERRFPEDRYRLLIQTDTEAQYTYEGMDQETAGYAGVFARLNLEPGDRVAALVDKSAQSLFLYLACLRFGLIYVPLNTAYRRKELEYFLGDAEPALVIGRSQDESSLRNLLPSAPHVYTLDSSGKGTLAEAASTALPFTGVRAVRSDDTAAIVYTSGTTGQPKGAMITHGNLAGNAETLVTAWSFTADDTLLHVLPLCHVHGLFVACHCALWSGARMRFLTEPDTAKILYYLPEASVMMGVPTHYARLIDSGQLTRDRCGNMRLFISGSAPLQPQTFQDFEQRTGHKILERYGMTETGMNTSNPVPGPRLPGTVGPPLPGIEVRIVKPDETPARTGETGNLQIRGSNVFKGYWHKPEKTSEAFTDDGYFITGDLASQDENRYIRIDGRRKDLIISGGYNIYPKEVELCIDGIPEVIESAVIGLPHPDYGETVCAVVVLRSGITLSEAALIHHVKKELASFKAPKSVCFVDELPRNAMGKVRKNVLRERLSA